MLGITSITSEVVSNMNEVIFVTCTLYNKSKSKHYHRINLSFNEVLYLDTEGNDVSKA